MCQRDIERLKVVPLVFDLRSIGHRESEPPHNLLQFFDRLRYRMQMTDSERFAGQRRVKLSGDRRWGGCMRGCEPLLGCGERRFNLRLDFVQPFACRRPIGSINS